MVAGGKRVEPEAVHLVGRLDARPEPALADRCLGTVGPCALVARRDADGRRAGPEHATDDAEDAVRRDLDLVGRGPPRPLGDDEATVAVGLEHEAAAGCRDPRPGLGEDVHPLAVAGPRRQVPDARDAGRRGWPLRELDVESPVRSTVASAEPSPATTTLSMRAASSGTRRGQDAAAEVYLGGGGVATVHPQPERLVVVPVGDEAAAPAQWCGGHRTGGAAARMSRVTGCSTVSPAAETCSHTLHTPASSASSR